ncbi:hypothetical protein UNDKW_5825 [Undibacterium sp. KW1]|uniref:hypothetical protein n=1 Tax=Undibacterium sp. KW1 TaxID=2058624 RepID=UPI001331EE19|nr:hypothetical protein [Undibacterium sp. KW1]BBB64098.1 hypothetical protein UNDKW_5825 [Undibacterium sp. KW1]
MTSRNDDMREAEFEDFLQGKGELASLLQDLPQAQPSAELDAAIIAEAELALAVPLATRTAPAIVPPAANDATGPEGNGKPPSFLWRWKLPLSLAASILFAIPVVMQQHQESYPTEPVTASASNARALPTAPAAPATQENDKSALPQLAQADLTKRAKVAAEVAAPAAPVASTSNAASPVMEASKANESQVADDARRASAAKPRSEFKPAEQQAESPPAPISASKSAPAPAPMVAAAPEPARVTVTGSAIRRQDMSAAAPAQVVSAEDKVAADSQYAGNAKMRSPAANASAAKAEATGMLAKTSETESRSSAAMAEKPVMTASADKKADMPAAVPFPAAPSAPRLVMAPPPVAAAPPLSAALAPEAHPGAYEWQEKIEQLLKNHRNKEALEEWRKFRASYPGFTVDQSLQKQIDALQK